ncbi:MAG TPA: MMPL family transporter [Solirubrobacteraceae bacterium]|jgi:RND superfamily putative drug exporter|nr:MMPL family transporter [Solirubrobacteraceae bacterium]
MPSTNFAARAGRWSARHRRAAIAGWLAFVVLAVGIGGTIGTQTLASHEKGAGESGRADRALHDAGLRDAATETILVTAPKGATVHTPIVQDAIADVRAAARESGRVSVVRAPQVSDDRRSALIQLQLRGDVDRAGEAVAPISAALDLARSSHLGVGIEQTGDGSIMKAYDDTMESDFKRAELFSVPITFAILFLAFGALVAAGIPVLLGLSAVAAGLGLLAIPSQALPVEETSSSVILLIGLAVGVDYALFYLRREREERAAGRSAEAALEAAAATSGRAVLVSGFTVMASVAGMFAAGNAWYSSYAVAIVIVVAIAMAGSVTVLPALLSKLGDRVERGRLPFVRRQEARAGDGGRVWNAVLARVLRRPLLSAVAATAVLLALAAPVAGLDLREQGMRSLPQDMPAVTTFERAQAAFPGGSRPAVVAVQAGDVTAPQVRAAIERLGRAAGAAPGLAAPVGVDVSPDRRVARVAVPLAGDGVEDGSEDALATLRGEVVPSTVGRVPGVRADVTGQTAASVDLRAVTTERGPLVFALVLGMGFLVLTMTFRSIVVPVKAIVLNLLSVLAAYGVLVLVFQHGWGASLLGFEPTGSIASWLPILLFVILFGLSMDYHVFVLSRIREAFDGGMPMDRAVEHGIKSTAGVVTSAAMVMVAVFSIFATLGIVDLKQFGVGLAVAVLVDATIVRAVLLPATMKMLGTWNWYLPRRLGWLPRLGEGPAAPEPARA